MPRVSLLALLLLVIGLLACGEQSPTETPTAVPAPTPESAPTPQPTATAAPTETPVPEATATAVPEPTATATPEPTSEPVATATPEPTPTATPEPPPAVDGRLAGDPEYENWVQAMGQFSNAGAWNEARAEIAAHHENQFYQNRDYQAWAEARREYVAHPLYRDMVKARLESLPVAMIVAAKTQALDLMLGHLEAAEISEIAGTNSETQFEVPVASSVALNIIGDAIAILNDSVRYKEEYVIWENSPDYPRFLARNEFRAILSTESDLQNSEAFREWRNADQNFLERYRVYRMHLIAESETLTKVKGSPEYEDAVRSTTALIESLMDGPATRRPAYGEVLQDLYRAMLSILTPQY